MIIGFDFFTAEVFDGNISAGSEINRIDIENVIIDEIKADTGSSTVYNTQKSDWGVDTVLKGDFKDSNFELGNVRLGGMPIKYLRVKKRKSGDLTWSKYVDILFDANEIEYNWSDYWVESLREYDYAIVPTGDQNFEGEYNIKNIICDYEDILIMGSNLEQYRLRANINMGEIQTVSPSVFIETLGSRYPYEISNGNVSYRKTSIKAMLISDCTLSKQNGIDRSAEKVLREKFYAFLTNKKPKVYKDGNSGDYMLVSIKADSVKIIPNNDLNRQICDVSFDVYEIEDVNSIQALQSARLLP